MRMNGREVRNPRMTKLALCFFIFAVISVGAAGAMRAQAGEDTAALETYYRNLPVRKILVDRERPGGTIPVYFRIAGSDNGRTAVLLHGINDTGFAYAGLARAMERDFRLIIVDLPAYGDSFIEKTLDFSYAAMTARLLALLRAVDALDGSLIIGHSTGGALAWHLALEKECRPAGIVLIDAVTVEFDLPGRTKFAFSLAKHSRLAGPLLTLVGPGTTACLIASESASPGFRTPELNRRLQAAMFTTPERLRVNAGWAVQLLDRPVLRAWAPRLKDIAVPTLLIWGREDRVLDVGLMAEAVGAIPNAHGVIIDGAGHSPHLEKPADVAGRVRTFAEGIALTDKKACLSPDVLTVVPAEIRPTRELDGAMLHLTASVSRIAGDAIIDAAALHLKRGYYSTEYPSQSGSAGLFLEGLRREGRTAVYAGWQIEFVWFRWGGFRLSQGWNLARESGPSSLWKLGYIPSYVPWLSAGIRWLGRGSKPGFYLTLELAPLLSRSVLFW